VASGAVAQELEYGPFGEVLFDSAPGYQPFGFAGGLYEPATGLVHQGAREYLARHGRWLSPDPIGLAGGDTNLYAYVHGDPVGLIDPPGLQGSNPAMDSATNGGFLSLIGFERLASGLRDRGDGLAMMSNDATFEAGLRLYRSGTCQLGAGIVDAMAIPAAVGMAVGGVSGAVSGPSLVRVNLIRANRVPTTRNGSLAGRNHPKTGVPFDKEGFPDFSAFRHPDYPDVRIELSGSRAQDFARANAASGLKSTPPKYTWHHHQDPGLRRPIETT
jgi:RHS repeat-associated protein